MTRRAYAPSPFFAFRTPLLPFESVEALAEGAAAPGAVGSAEALAAAVEADAEAQRGRLRALVARPEVREAIFLASPDLEQAIDGWLADPRSEKGRRAERALVKYAMRMASRATPFGLFAGTAVGRVGDESRLAVGSRASLGRRSRLDADWLSSVADALAADPSLRGELTYRPNSSAYPAGGRWRYVEARADGAAKRYRLVAVDDSPQVSAALERASAGARLAELAEVVRDEEVTAEEAAGFVAELVEAQLLVPETGLLLTGPDGVAGLAGTLRRHAATVPAAVALEEAAAGLARLDAEGAGADPSRYRELASGLSGMPVEPTVSRLFQVDLVDTASEAALGRPVLEEIERGVDLLHALMPPRGNDLRDFVDAFEERWGLREVPLAEALDEESGIGYPVFAAEDDSSSPLLDGLPFPDAPAGTARWGAREVRLLRLLSHALASGAREIALSDADVAALSNSSPAPLPGAFAALVKVAADSPEALGKGKFEVVFESAGGPSGARFLGRFCPADAELERYTREHLRAEEALEPDAVYAEVVHLPEGRSGNVVRRPLFRDHEIPYLGASGAPVEQQIPVTDLLVSVRAGRVVLRSRRLGRRVVPRQTAAHNYVAYGLGIYRFLCALQAQGTAGGVLWDWGALSSAPYLPRVRKGRVVLSAARWNLSAEEIARLTAPATAADRYRAVAGWRVERRLPRYVLVADLAEELLVDLDAVLSVEAFLHLAKGEERLELKEMLPGPDALCARGAEGRFVHEALVPFVGSEIRRDTPARGSAAAGESLPPDFRRTFAPGSEWLTLKVYGGNASLERLLRERLGPLASGFVERGATDRWFFLRYADPRAHLRLRFHGEPARLREALLPELVAGVEASLGEGLAWRAQLDTYEREVERYGGPEGVLLAEKAFHADSEAVLEILGMLEEGPAGEEERWRLAVFGADLLMSDLGLSDSARLSLVRSLRRAYGAEHREDGALRHALGGLWRTRGREVGALLAREPGVVEALGPGIEALDRRSLRIKEIGRELRDLEQEGRLRQTREGIAASLVHMHLNRLFPSAQLKLELVVHELLSRAVSGRAARGALSGVSQEAVKCPG